MNPIDFSLWRNIEDRMYASAPKGRESVKAFKERLRRIALATPRREVRKMIASMRRKAKQIYEASGGNIASD